MSMDEERVPPDTFQDAFLPFLRAFDFQVMIINRTSASLSFDLKMS